MPGGTEQWALLMTIVATMQVSTAHVRTTGHRAGAVSTLDPSRFILSIVVPLQARAMERRFRTLRAACRYGNRQHNHLCIPLCCAAMGDDVPYAGLDLSQGVAAGS